MRCTSCGETTLDGDYYRKRYKCKDCLIELQNGIPSYTSGIFLDSVESGNINRSLVNNTFDTGQNHWAQQSDNLLDQEFKMLSRQEWIRLIAPITDLEKRSVLFCKACKDLEIENSLSMVTDFADQIDEAT